MYKEKYLKYKNKYQLLKIAMGGAELHDGLYSFLTYADEPLLQELLDKNKVAHAKYIKKDTMGIFPSKEEINVVCYVVIKSTHTKYTYLKDLKDLKDYKHCTEKELESPYNPFDPSSRLELIQKSKCNESKSFDYILHYEISKSSYKLLSHFKLNTMTGTPAAFIGGPIYGDNQVHSGIYTMLADSKNTTLQKILQTNTSVHDLYVNAKKNKISKGELQTIIDTFPKEAEIKSACIAMIKTLKTTYTCLDDTKCKTPRKDLSSEFNPFSPSSQSEFINIVNPSYDYLLYYYIEYLNGIPQYKLLGNSKVNP